MAQNLREFVSKFVEKGNKDSFPHLYIVDKETGPFRRIQDAIDAAEPNSLIKVTQGFYEQRLLIQKPLTIEPKSVAGKDPKVGVVLLVESGIGIHVKLPFSESQVNISGVKVSHTGNTSELQMQFLQHQHILNIFEQHEKQSDQLEHEYINRVAFSKIENMVLFVESGRVKAEMCVLSLKYLVKSCRLIIPAICIDRDGYLEMCDSDIKGNEEKDTIGILCKLGELHLQNCVISDHRQGGVIVWGVGENASKIIKNRVERNSVGIHAVGEEFKMKIYQNQVKENKVGIKVGLACEVEVSRNFITENDNGIEVYSSSPLIYLNKINKNKLNGIATHSYKKMICNAKIKKNVSITGNQKSGILIEGENNKTKVVENYLIGFNSQSGIKVSKDAFPLILKNKIYKNFHEGILITEDANAVIERNDISHNIACNIALGGVSSHNTLIAENAIKSSPGAGIYMIEGMCNISRNDITDNTEGIRLVESSGKIRRNYISNNKNDGVFCEGECSPILVENLITRNASIGLFFGEESGLLSASVIHSNIIISNEINLGVDFNNDAIFKSLKASNTIEGEITEPQNYGCAIM